MASIETSLSNQTNSVTVVKFLNNPAIAPYLAVANNVESGLSVSTYLIQVTTGLNTNVSFFMPILSVPVPLATASLPTIGITAFTPAWRFPAWWPGGWWPGWLAELLRTIGLGR
jgi:hypothetical protein